MVKTKHTLYNCQADFHLWSSIHANRKYVDMSNFKQEQCISSIYRIEQDSKGEYNYC